MSVGTRSTYANRDLAFEPFRSALTVDTHTAALVRACALRHQAEVEVCHAGMATPALSLLGILSLGITPGSLVQLRARGPEADRAEASIRQILLSPPTAI